MILFPIGQNQTSQKQRQSLNCKKHGQLQEDLQHGQKGHSLQKLQQQTTNQNQRFLKELTNGKEQDKWLNNKTKNKMEINKIYKSDCLELMSKMPDNFVDVIVTSPPYNIGINRLNSGKNKNYDSYSDNLSKEEYFEQTKFWIDEMIRVTKHHVFYNIQELTGNKGIVKFLLNNYSEYIKETFIWAKSNPQSSIVKTMAGSGFEYIFCFVTDN